jgi:hypothetical protein
LISKRVGGQCNHPPARTESYAQLVFGDPPGTPIAGLAVAETHEVQVATRAECGVRSRDVATSTGVGEDMEQTAVDEGVEPLAQGVEKKHVKHPEGGVDATLGEADEGGLRAPDVPGRRRAGIRVIPVTVRGPSFGHILILPAAHPWGHTPGDPADADGRAGPAGSRGGDSAWTDVAAAARRWWSG